MSAANLDEASIRNFRALSRDEQVTVIRQMAASGWGDYGLAAATRLSVEQIRQVLAEEVTP